MNTNELIEFITQNTDKTPENILRFSYMVDACRCSQLNTPEQSQKQFRKTFLFVLEKHMDPSAATLAIDELFKIHWQLDNFLYTLLQALKNLIEDFLRKTINNKNIILCNQPNFFTRAQQASREVLPEITDSLVSSIFRPAGL